MNEPLVSIILPTYNRCQIIERSINSVLRQNYSNIELIIVNDGSTDKTVHILEKIRLMDRRVKVYNNFCKIGLPSSRNRGLLCSRGDLIFFSEDDLILDNCCISTLVSSLRQLEKVERKVGAVGPRLISVPHLDIKLPQVVFVNPITKDIKVNFEINTYQPVEVPFLHSCSLIRRDALLTVGGYESKLYKGSYSREETDFYFRLRRKGYRLFFESNAIAYHHSGGLGGCILPSKFVGEFYNVRNHFLYLARFYGLSTVFYFPSFLAFYLFDKLKGL